MGNNPEYWRQKHRDWERSHPSEGSYREPPPPPSGPEIWRGRVAEYHSSLSKWPDETFRQRLEETLVTGAPTHFQFDFAETVLEDSVDRYVAELTKQANSFAESLSPQLDRQLMELRKQIVAADPECERRHESLRTGDLAISLWLGEMLEREETPLRAERDRRRQAEEEQKRREEEDRKRKEVEERVRQEEERKRLEEEIKLQEEARKKREAEEREQKEKRNPGIVRITRVPPEFMEMSVSSLASRKSEFDPGAFSNNQVKYDPDQDPNRDYWLAFFWKPHIPPFVPLLADDTRVTRWRARDYSLPIAAKLKLIEDELARREKSRGPVERLARRVMRWIGVEW